jgi:hypothetical protein
VHSAQQRHNERQAAHVGTVITLAARRDRIVLSPDMGMINARR